MYKKVLSLLIVFIMMFSVVSIATASAATEEIQIFADKNDSYGIYVGQFGDSDGNGSINVKDATNVQKYVAGMITLPQSRIAASNVDGNQDVNVRDATAIQKHLAGISVKSDIGMYLYIVGNHVHDYVLGAVAPKCEEDVYEVYSCICGDEYQGNVIPSIGHNYVKTVVAPTCTADGYTTYKCSNCLHTYKDSYVKSEGHKYTSKVVAATCIAQGYTEHTCSVCNDSYKDSYTSGGNHSYTSKVVAPTCTAQGYTQYTCGLCNNSYKDNYTAVTSHSYNSSGKCSVCGAAQPVTDSKVTAFDSVASWMKQNGELTDDGEAYGLSAYYIPELSDFGTAIFYQRYDNEIEIVVEDQDNDLFTWVTITRGSNYAEYVYFLGEDLAAEGTFAINSITSSTSSLDCEIITDTYGLYDYDPAVVKELAAACVRGALSTYTIYDSYYSIPSSLKELGFTKFETGGSSPTPPTDSKTKAFDDLASWMKRNGSLNDDGDAYIITTYMPVDGDLTTAIFYYRYENTIEIFINDNENGTGAWVTITRGSSYADYTLISGDFLIAEGSFSTSSISKNTTSLSYSDVYNPLGVSSSSIKKLSASSVKLALASYNYYETYFGMPTSLYELGFTNY